MFEDGVVVPRWSKLKRNRCFESHVTCRTPFGIGAVELAFIDLNKNFFCINQRSSEGVRLTPFTLTLGMNLVRG
jgi:hypothetical protein